MFFTGSGSIRTQEPTQAQVRVYSANRLIQQAATTVRAEEFAPHGKECGPVVSQARVEFEADNTLRQVPVSQR